MRRRWVLLLSLMMLYLRWRRRPRLRGTHGVERPSVTSRHAAIVPIRHKAIQMIKHAPFLFHEQVIRSGDVIVLVQLQTSHRVFSREAECVQLTQDILFKIVLFFVQVSRRRRRLCYLSIPRMRTHYRNGESFVRLRGQQPRYQILHFLADELWRAVVRCHDFLVQSCRVLILERQIAAYKRKQDNAAAPKVAQRWHVAVACDHLWSSITRRSARGFQELAVPKDVAQAEVHDLDTPMVIKK